MYVVGRTSVVVLVTVGLASTKIEDVVVMLMNCVRMLKTAAFSTGTCGADIVIGMLSVIVRFWKMVESFITVVGTCNVLETKFSYLKRRSKCRIRRRRSAVLRLQVQACKNSLCRRPKRYWDGLGGISCHRRAGDIRCLDKRCLVYRRQKRVEVGELGQSGGRVPASERQYLVRRDWVPDECARCDSTCKYI